MRVVSVVGARPQFVKAAAFSRILRRAHAEFLVHTGQHYDYDMSAVFFDELEIPPPDINLEIGSGPHGEQTAGMLRGIERVLLEQVPDWVLVYGDTNSTIAGALAAAKLQIPVAHVEAGLRSFNRAMPEELNRVVVDHLSTALFCPSMSAADNLAAEGIREGVHVVGDVMSEALSFAATRAREKSEVLTRLEVSERRFVLATVHRAENTDDGGRLRAILTGLEASAEPVIFPVHPRTREALERVEYRPPSQVRLIAPLGYLDMVRLAGAARMILTDSGGLQKEAYWLGVPCLTLRDETEWVETVRVGWNRLVGADSQQIGHAILTFEPPQERPVLYDEGQSVAERCITVLVATNRLRSAMPGRVAIR